jgi:predicted O-linked N-acetylglucosamine transferase (SPINDLY family)
LLRRDHAQEQRREAMNEVRSSTGRSDPGEAASADRAATAALWARARAFATAGNFKQAIALYRDLLAHAADDPELQRELGRALRQTGAIDEAIACYRRAIALAPGDARAHDELGRTLSQQGDLRQAAEHLRAALARDPSLVAARVELGELLLRDGRAAEAVTEFHAALALDATNWAVHFRLGAALARLGPDRLDEAMGCFRRVIAALPGHAPAHQQIGMAFWNRGDPAPAIALLERAVRLEPKLPAGHAMLGAMLRSVGRSDEAIASLRVAVAADPNDAMAAFHLGTCLCEATAGNVQEGASHLRRAIALAPGNVQAHIRLCSILAETGRREDALAAYRAALTLHPDDPTLQIGATMAELPMICDDAAQIEQCRASYSVRLDALRQFFAARPAHAARQDAEAIGSAQPFFLAYHGRNDREPQARYGDMVAAVMRAAYPQWAQAPDVAPPAPGEPVRVAIVSGHFWGHSVLKIPIWGWVSLLDRRRFRLLGYHTRARIDIETARISRSFDRFVQGPLPVERWCEVIRADAPHVIVYPELGMDAVTPKLAGLRLAPVQCCGPGHPTTSGFPTLDYFLSSDVMEPADAQSHYTERLVRLPNLGVAYVPPPTETATIRRDAIGLRPDAVAFWCCQHLPKYQPEHDGVFAAIAQRADNAQFVFIASPRGDELTQRFRARLARAFAAQGVDVDRHVIMLPRMTTAEFLGVAAICDVFLDSIGWSGHNSALETLSGVDLPIVTWPGPLMRGRHCGAILQMLGIGETIARSQAEYVDIAARLARDPGLRAALRARTAAGKAKLFADPAPVRALEQWMDEVVRRPLSAAAPSS